MLLRLRPDVEVLEKKERSDTKKKKSIGQSVDRPLTDNGPLNLIQSNLSQDNLNQDNINQSIKKKMK